MKKISIILAGTIACIFLFCICAEKSVQGSVFYNFKYNGEDYRIRSVSSENNGFSYNELIGEKFVANDYDQDGFIDKITLGQISLSDAQRIYEYILSMLTEQDKLHEIKPTYHYYHFGNLEYTYEIKSFQPRNIEPFNQFKIVERERKTENDFIMGIDQKADGSIDTVAVGFMPFEKIQSLYSELIKKGLESQELIKIGKMIIVK